VWHCAPALAIGVAELATGSSRPARICGERKASILRFADAEGVSSRFYCFREVLGQYLERFGKIHLMGVEKAAGPNRFRYWDLKEAGTDVPLYGFSMSNGRVICGPIG